MAAQLEIVLLDGSQTSPPNSTPNAPPANRDTNPAPMPPNAQTGPNQHPQPTPTAPTPGRQAMPEPVQGANRTVADTLDLPSLDEVARHLEEMAASVNAPMNRAEESRFEEADANYRHENPEPRTERTQPQPANNADSTDASDTTRGAVVRATDTVQEAIEAITGGATEALERLERLIQEARGERQPAQGDPTSRTTPQRSRPPRTQGARRNTVGRAIGRNLAGQFGNRLRRTRTGRAVMRAARSPIGRSVGRAVAGTAGRAVAGAAARGAMTTVAGAGAGAAASGAAVGGLTTAGVAIGAVAVPVAAATVAALAFAAALRKAGDVANNVGDQLEEFSAAILAQRSASEMRMFALQTDRAERIGPAVAQVEAAQARLSEAMYEVQTDIYEILAKLAPKVEMGFDAVAAGVKGVVAMKEGIDVLLNLGSAKERQEFQAAAVDFTLSIAEVFANNAPAGRDQLLMQLFNQFPNQPPPVRPNRKPAQKPFVIRP